MILISGLAAPTPASAAPLPTVACSASASASKVVVAGDSWYGLARSGAIGLDALLAANAATSASLIVPGQTICLPKGSVSSPPSPETGATDNSSKSSPCSSEQLSPYLVADGDSWFAIAQRAGTGIRALFDANRSTQNTALHPGDIVCVPAAAAASMAASGRPIATFPVEGPCAFADSWHAPRGGLRRHEGVDVIAGKDRKVYAYVDGILTRRAWDQAGSLSGNGWWLTSADGSGAYYFYAHLAGFAPGLQVGSRVRSGDVIGFVGSTGNSAGPHLHFEIHPGGGAAVNPYSTLRAIDGCVTVNR